MKSQAAGRNWRLETLAWAGAIALVAAALLLSRGHEETPEAPSDPVGVEHLAPAPAPPAVTP